MKNKFFSKMKNKLKNMILEMDDKTKNKEENYRSNRYLNDISEDKEIEELEELNKLFKGQRQRIRKKRMDNTIFMPEYNQQDEEKLFEQLFDKK